MCNFQRARLRIFSMIDERKYKELLLNKMIQSVNIPFLDVTDFLKNRKNNFAVIESKVTR